MKFVYNVQLEPTDIALAISAYLKANGVEAEVTVAQLEEFNEDFSLSISAGGVAPVVEEAKTPVKRKRRSPSQIAADKAAEEEAKQEEEPEIATKQQAVVIEDDSTTSDPEPDLMQQALDEVDAEEKEELKASIKAKADEAKSKETETATTEKDESAQEGAPLSIAKKSIFKRKK